MDDLEKRVTEFHRFGLPGQTVMMPIEARQLVDALWSEVLRLRSLAGAVSPGPSFPEIRAMAHDSVGHPHPVLRAFDGA